MLLTVLQKKYKNLKVLVNDILMNIRTMDGIFVPINKHGKQSTEAVRQIDDIFKSDYQVLTFPAGLVSRKHHGVIRDPEWKKNFITKAVRSKRDIVPIHVSGRCTNFFYFMANLRKFLRIKSNLEMMLLPDETYRHRNEHIMITIGYPVKWQTFDNRFSPAEWAAKMQDYVYTLPGGNSVPFTDQTAIISTEDIACIILSLNLSAQKSINMEHIIPPVPKDKLVQELTEDKFITADEQCRKSALHHHRTGFS